MESLQAVIQLLVCNVHASLLPQSVTVIYCGRQRPVITIAATLAALDVEEWVQTFNIATVGLALGANALYTATHAIYNSGTSIYEKLRKFVITAQISFVGYHQGIFLTENWGRMVASGKAGRYTRRNDRSVVLWVHYKSHHPASTANDCLDMLERPINAGCPDGPSAEIRWHQP